MIRSPQVSIVLISYNGEKFIEKQISSILEQLHHHDELIITDDGSTDRTETIIIGIKDPRIKYVNGPQNGINSNVSFGINTAKNNLILLSDQDDMWLPGRIKYFLTMIESGVDFVFFDASVIDAEDNIIIPSYFQHHNASRSFIGNLVKCRTLGCCIGFTKTALNQDFILPESYKYLPFDYYLTLYALAFCKVTFSNTPYHLYRRHDQNISTGGSKSTNSFLQMLQFRLRALWYLVKYSRQFAVRGLSRK